MYEQIAALREVGSAQKRGYLFEQVLREILPWDVRPPLAVTAPSEQLDAFFEWNSWHFLLEAKAKKKPITPGSHDWEDFELKLRKRRGACIGLFCSLFSVRQGVVEAAEALNREGLCTLVLHDDVWKSLAVSRLRFDILLRHMVLAARSTFRAVPEEPEKIKRWHYDRDSIARRVSGLCRARSARFLRRHQHPRHSEIYVPRELDAYVVSASRALRPSTLMILRRHSRRHGVEITHKRSRPRQIVLVRDASGSGKTTFAVNVGLSADSFIGVSRAASEVNIDDLDELLTSVGQDYGVHELIAVDATLVYAIDSLDEAGGFPGKGKELISLVRLLDELNEIAVSYGLVAFPLLLVFTVREEYWLEWATYFEGLPASTLRNRFSVFTESEFELALHKYSDVYHYAAEDKLTPRGRSILSVPFNLRIFSEANEYALRASFADVLEEKALALYLNKKADNILHRRIPHFTRELFLGVCSGLAVSSARNRTTTLSRKTISASIIEEYPALASSVDTMIVALRSEQILLQDPETPTEFRFSHSRIVEYLAAYYVVREVAKTGSPEHLEELTDLIFQSEIVSMFRVHDFIRYVCRQEYPEVLEVVQAFYRQSNRFMRAIVSNQRTRISLGAKTTSDDLSLILKNTEASDPRVSWDAFFVLAAKPNKQDSRTVAEAFDLAWRANEGVTERWKLIDKMSQRSLLLDETVLMRLLESGTWKEWEVFLGSVLEEGSDDEFRSMWEATRRDRDGKPVGWEGDDWRMANRLLEAVVDRVPYETGSLNL